jgi:hypothetical protein
VAAKKKKKKKKSHQHLSLNYLDIWISTRYGRQKI